MPSNHLILCCPLLLLSSVFPSISIFSSGLALCIRCWKYWSFSFSISPSNEYSRFIFFRMDWFDLFTVHGTVKSLLQHHSLKVSVLQHSAFFMVQLSHICTWLHYSFLDQYSCKFCVLWLVGMSLKSPVCRFLLHFSSHCPLPLCLVACLRNGVVYPEFSWLQLLDVQYVLLFFSFPVNWLLNVKAWYVLFINLFAKIDLYVVLYTTKERSWDTIYIHFHICSVVFSIFILKLKVVQPSPYSISEYFHYHEKK